MFALVPTRSTEEPIWRKKVAETINYFLRRSFVESLTAPATATNGTISTSGINVSRINPAGAITGVILEAGTEEAQEVAVINESANTVTFAAAATSNVADGAGAVIAATRSMYFVWDTQTLRWYRT